MAMVIEEGRLVVGSMNNLRAGVRTYIIHSCTHGHVQVLYLQDKHPLGSVSFHLATWRR